MNTPRKPDERVPTAKPFRNIGISGHEMSAPHARGSSLTPHPKADTLLHALYPVALMAANEDIPDAKALQSDAALRARAGATSWDAYAIWHCRIRLLPGATSLFVTPH
jgi:hypothetical protein